jgi:transcriptional regulator with XRE-family HTH domain
MFEGEAAPDARPGAVLKALRLRRGWTLAEVSQKTGLPISTVSKVENDKMSLSYDKLVRISQGLGIDISRLFDDGVEPQQTVTGRRSINRAGEGRWIHTKNYDHLYAATDLLNKRFVPTVSDIRARTLGEFGELMRHPGEEYAYVLEGTLDLHTSFYAPVRLHKGDSIYFDSGMGHAYLVVGDEPCRLLTICTATDDDQEMSAETPPPPLVVEADKPLRANGNHRAAAAALRKIRPE